MHKLVEILCSLYFLLTIFLAAIYSSEVSFPETFRNTLMFLTIINSNIFSSDNLLYIRIYNYFDK